LIKPQFEVDKGNFNSAGVAVNEKLQEDLIERIRICSKALNLELPKGPLLEF
jgi:predicted rRNA methylase YqxC with S4 and FtsJ domains